jgi:eukaryotic-like serine/threonine-protein kinase
VRWSPAAWTAESSTKRHSSARQGVALSPDGTEIASVANRRIYLRSISDLEPRAIPGTEIIQGLTNPVFSPDGRFIAFFSAADNTLKKIAVSGGAAVTLCPANNPYGMSWGPDGIVFGQAGTAGRGIMRVSPNGGKPELLVSVKGDELAVSPQMLPGGQAVLFALAKGGAADRWNKAQILVQSLKSGERKILVEGGSDARYVPTGHLVYALGGTLFALPFDATRLQVTSGPAPVLEGVARAALGGGNAGTAQFSVSNTGSLIYGPGPAGATVASSGGRALVLTDRKGGSERLKLPPGSYEHPRVSPDGKRVAFGTDDGKEAIVWIYDLAGTTSMRQLTFGGRNRFPIWSADGQHVAFQSDREGDLGIFWQRADGTGAAERLTKPDQGTCRAQ